jgi:hypothetical protein
MGEEGRGGEGRIEDGKGRRSATLPRHRRVLHHTNEESLLAQPQASIGSLECVYILPTVGNKNYEKIKSKFPVQKPSPNLLSVAFSHPTSKFQHDFRFFQHLQPPRTQRARGCLRNPLTALSSSSSAGSRVRAKRAGRDGLQAARSWAFTRRCGERELFVMARVA